MAVRLLFTILVLTGFPTNVALAQDGERPVRLIVGGDVMAPLRVKAMAFENGLPQESYFGSLIEQLKPIVSSADIAFANLETPVATTIKRTPRPFVFNAPQDLVKGLKWVGFDIVSVANNHSLDQGSTGLKETVAAVKNEGLIPVGGGHDRESALQGHVYLVKGVRIGFLAFTTFLNGGNQEARSLTSPYLNLTDRRKDIAESIAAMKKRADIILLSVHWGVEYASRPSKWQEDMAKDFHEQGVDVIIGHHPHVLQPMRWYVDKAGKRKLTIYSLGNLISNQSAGYTLGRSPAAEGNTRDGSLVSLEVTKDGIKSVGFYPTWVDNWNGPQQGLRTVYLHEELERVQKRIDEERPSPMRSFLIARKNLLLQRYSTIFRALFPNAKVPELERKQQALTAN